MTESDTRKIRQIQDELSSIAEELRKLRGKLSKHQTPPSWLISKRLSLHQTRVYLFRKLEEIRNKYQK